MRRIWDTETTGLNPVLDVIVEVGAVDFFEDGRRYRGFGSLIQPPAEILEDPRIDKALEINYITREELRKAPSIDEVVWRLKQWMEQNIYDEQVIDHCYNNDFDMKFLCRPPWPLVREQFGECIMKKFAKFFDPYRGRWQKLWKAAAHFDLPWNGPEHRAETDADMAGRVFFKVKEAVGA